VSRNPSRRTDVAGHVRITRALTRRTTVSLLGGAGRESYLVAGTIQSLNTLTGVAGIRYTASSGTTLRFDVTGVRSRPILTRNGVSVGVERAL
jgi:type IV secretory pathway TrbD component